MVGSYITHICITYQIINMTLFRDIDKCKVQVGIEDKRIPDSAFTASSWYNYQYGPDRARLNQNNDAGGYGAWYAKHHNKNQWLQVRSYHFNLKKRQKWKVLYAYIHVSNYR